MLLKKFLLLFIIKFTCGSVRVMFSRCAFGGFTCVNVGKNIALYYQCPAGTDDIVFYINSFSAPSNAESLVIQKCNKVNVFVKCTADRRNIQTVQIMNIKYLTFERTNYVSTIPPNLILKDIEYIESIPSFTFSQYIKPLHSGGCTVPTQDFRNFSMNNVKIDTVESNAFYMPNAFGLFHISNVTINRLQSSAIIIKFNKTARFVLNNSSIGILEHLAIQAVGKDLTISNNKFIDISAGAINGTIEDFHFNDNIVNTLHPHAISILSKNVLIQSNKIEYLKSGALEKISPGLLEDSGRNFGSLRFKYLFRENYVKYMDAGSLTPDVDAYNNVASEVDIIFNLLNCNCDNIAWLISPLGHGSNTQLLSDLYETILDDESKNTCAHTCQLRLSSILRMVNEGECDPSITTDYLCAEKDKTTTVSTTKMLVAINSTTPLRSTKTNGGAFLPRRSSASMNQKNILLIMLLGLFGII